MNLARLLQMSPAEIGTRAQQAFSKRWSNPPACRLIHLRAVPSLSGPAAARITRRQPNKSANTASTC